MGRAVTEEYRKLAASEGLEEITVTARRQTENLLDVPVTVAVMTAEAMETRNINDLYGMGIQIDVSCAAWPRTPRNRF